MNARLREAGPVATRMAMHAAVAVLLSWPLAAHLGTAIPLGTETAPTVPWFNLWTMEWNHQALLPGGPADGSWWDAPIFAPETGTFALSDPQPLTGALYSVLRRLGASTTAAYGLVVLGTSMLNGLAGARLARRTGAAEAVAVLTGLLAQTLPFVWRELGVLQLTAVYPLLFGLDALRRWAADGRLRPALELGGWTGVAFLTSTYYGLFWVLVLPLSMWRLGDRSWWSAERLRSAAAGIAVAAVVSAPLLLGIAQRTSSYERSSATVERNSAQLADWVRLDDAAIGSSVVPWLADDGGSGQRLYPGTGLTLLAFGGWWVGRRDPDDSRARWARACATAALVAALMSLGATVAAGGVRPYDLVRFGFPGFLNLRSPFRFAALTQVALVPLAGIALAALWDAAPRLRRPDLARGALVALTLLALVEVVPGRSSLTGVPDPDRTWVAWLRDHSAVGAVAHVPFADGGSVQAFEPTVEAMLLSLAHEHPLANGYSGLFPTSSDALEAAMATFPDPASIAALRSAGVTHVVVEDRWSTSQARAAVVDAGLVEVVAGGGATVWVLPPPRR